MISFDISKAFGCIWHQGLLAELPILGLHYNRLIGFFLICLWLLELTGSSPIFIEPKADVPQGSFISPVLFILFIKGMFSILPT